MLPPGLVWRRIARVPGPNVKPRALRASLRRNRKALPWELVRSGFRDEVDDAVGGPAEFGGIAAALHLEFLEPLDAGAVEDRIVPAFAVGFGAVQAFALAVEQSAADARVALIPDDARGQDDEGHGAAQSVAQEQRQIHDR